MSSYVKDKNDYIRYALELAKQLNIENLEISINCSKDKYINTIDGRLENLEQNTSNNVGVTVYKNQKFASTTSTEISFTAIKSIITAASEMCTFLDKDTAAKLPDKHLLQYENINLDLYHPNSPNDSSILEKCYLVESQMKSYSNEFSLFNPEVHFNASKVEGFYANSLGLYQRVNETIYSISGSALAITKSGHKYKDYSYHRSRLPLIDGDNNILAKEVIDNLSHQIGGTKISSQHTPVIFSSRVSYTLINYLIAAIKGSNIYNKNSFLATKLNKAIMPEFCEISETPYLKQGLKSSHFDANGVKTSTKAIIQKGVLNQFLYDNYYANKLNTQSTGNAGGAYNIFVKPTTSGLGTMIKNMHTGLVIDGLLGSCIDLTTGSYSQGVRGYWVENGIIKHAVNEVTVAGNLLEMFRSIVAIGDDINKFSSVQIGSVLISRISIAGK